MTRLVSGGEALVTGLVTHGVDTVFGIPGTHNLEIYRHLARAGVRHIGVRHEQGAGYAADGYARTTGRPGVAVVTTGPAVLNAATALVQAWTDSVPVLLVSPGLPLRHPALGNGLLHESRDQGGAIAATGVTSLRATSVSEIPTAVTQAFALMLSGRPRAVHLEVPLDVLVETGLAGEVAPAPLPRHLADEAAVSAAADLLADADRPVVVIGGGAKGAAPEVQALVELLGAPAVSTANGKGVLPEDHPLSLGAGVHLPAVRTLVEDADAVVAIGTELAPADHWYGPYQVDDRLVRIDVDPVGIVTNARPRVGIVADAAAAVTALVAALTGRRTPADIDVTTWRERRRRDAREEGADWVAMIDELVAVLPRDVIVGADNAMACYYGAMTNLPTYTPASYLFPAGFGTLGYGLPAAIGAKIANPERPVLAMLGDGGAMFTLPELAAAADARLALPVLVIDNSGYGEIRNEMIAREDPVHAVTFTGTDFAAVGRAMGCRGATLDGTDGLGAAVAEAFAADRPTVIHLLLPDPAAEGGNR